MKTERRRIGLEFFPVWCKHAIHLEGKKRLSAEDRILVKHLNRTLEFLIQEEKKQKTPPGKRTVHSVLAFELLIQCSLLNKELRIELANLIRIKASEPSFEYC